MASSLPSSSTQTRTSAPRSPAAAATVRSTISAGSLYTGTKTSTATPLAGRLRLAHPLVGARPPEPEGLDEVEELGRDQHAVEVRGADPVRVEQPAEVPDRQRQPEQGHDAHPGPDADVGRHGLPCHLAQADVPGAAAHRNSHTLVCGVLELAQLPALEVELPDHLVGPVEEEPRCPGRRRARTPGCPRAAWGSPARSGRLRSSGA